MVQEITDTPGSVSEVTDLTSSVSGSANLQSENPDSQVAAQQQQGGPKDTSPNVRLTKEGQPLNEGPVIIGQVKVMIPDEATQRQGFYAENSGELVAQYRQYKFIQVKGQPNTQGVNIS